MMNKRTLKYILYIGLPIAILFSIWAINTYLNEKQFNEEKADLFDECLDSSYLLLKEVHNSLLLIIDFYENNSYTVYAQDPYNFKESFMEYCNEGYMKNPSARKAYIFLEHNSLFIGSAVFLYLTDGGKKREKYSQAIAYTASLWLELTNIPDKEYDELIEYLHDKRNLLLNIMATLSECKVNPKPDIYAFKEIEPLSKLYIWERHNERENWPFKTIIDFFKRK